MSDAKLDRILEVVAAVHRDVHALKTEVNTLKTDLGVLKSDVAALKTDVGTLKEGQEQVHADIGRLEERRDETVRAFKRNWGDMADLYRRVREDVTHFEDRLESKLGQINLSIQALRDSLERQDYRTDELGRRVSRLEEQPRDL